MLRSSRPVLLAAAALAACAAGCSDSSSSASAGGAGAGKGWVLAWADEFNGADGAPADPAKWTALVGGDGWGNAEREYYTAESANVHQQGGSLEITASTAGIEGKSCWYGPCTHTSARLETKGKFEQKYGRVEARIQIPRGQGTWSAFWMLGANIDAVSWPACGEVDIMENVGKEPKLVHGSMHGPGYAGGGALTHEYALPSGVAFAADYHLYAVEWDAKGARFYVDDALYETRAPEDAPSGATWAYDHPFYLLLNLAVGGTWPGDPDATTEFPATMKIDYVRAYAPR
jgi:beta-glucanase (GH16 family)